MQIETFLFVFVVKFRNIFNIPLALWLKKTSYAKLEAEGILSNIN